jgi:hypothetical protein
MVGWAEWGAHRGAGARRAQRLPQAVHGRPHLPPKRTRSWQPRRAWKTIVRDIALPWAKGCHDRAILTSKSSDRGARARPTTASRSVDQGLLRAPALAQGRSAKCLNWSIVTRAHVPRHAGYAVSFANPARWHRKYRCCSPRSISIAVDNSTIRFLRRGFKRNPLSENTLRQAFSKVG